MSAAPDLGALISFICELQKTIAALTARLEVNEGLGQHPKLAPSKNQSLIGVNTQGSKLQIQGQN